jgi:adenylyltransferase/sulfurtransferase
MNDKQFLIDDDDRYSRLRLIAWWDQDKLAAARVLVVGAGALGNEVLKNLALVGIGHIDIVDFDVVEDSNLARSVFFRPRDRGGSKAEIVARALQDMNPDTRTRPFHADVITDIGLGLFREADVVVGCLDNREARLWVNRQCWKVGTPWVDGGIQEINGVVKVFVPPDSACYECAMTENDYRLINLRYSCPLLRQKDLQAGKVPTAPTISSMIGGLQAQEALKIIHCLPVDAGVAQIYNGIANQFYKTAFQRRPDCLSHETYDPLNAIGLSAKTATVNALFDACRSAESPAGEMTLHLDRDLVVSLDCEPCQSSRAVMRSLPKVGMQEAHCDRCGEIAKPKMAHAVSADSPLAHETLSALGVPAFDIVHVTTAVGDRYVLLDGDREEVLVVCPH